MRTRSERRLQENGKRERRKETERGKERGNVNRERGNEKGTANGTEKGNVRGRESIRIWSASDCIICITNSTSINNRNYTNSRCSIDIRHRPNNTCTIILPHLEDSNLIIILTRHIITTDLTTTTSYTIITNPSLVHPADMPPRHCHPLELSVVPAARSSANTTVDAPMEATINTRRKLSISRQQSRTHLLVIPTGKGKTNNTLFLLITGMLGINTEVEVKDHSVMRRRQ